MTTTQNGEYVVTSCPNHGVTVVADFDSFRAYVDVARDCAHAVAVEDDYEHRYYHIVMQHDCWTCCTEQVVDPHGLLDH